MVGTNTYAAINVNILSYNASTGAVTFTAADTGATQYVLPWGNLNLMWTPCPSTVAPDATPDKLTAPPVIGPGSLYLSNGFLDHYGFHEIPKWPKQMAELPPYAPLTILPTSLVLSGMETADGYGFSGTIDLLDPRLAAAGQKVSLDGGRVTLLLSAAGFAAFHQEFDAFGQLAASVAAVEAPSTTPSAKATAWHIIAQCAQRLSEGAAVSDADKATLQRVIPDLK